LSKLPKYISHFCSLELWLTLLKAKTEDDLKKIQAKWSPIMNQAIEAYRSLASSHEFRELERLRKKAEHDEAQAISVAVNKIDKKS
jgi:hypothetical protein